ncbi:hypothetical protein D3C78_1439050 [compost metagenome]
MLGQHLARHVLVHVVDDADAGLLQAQRGGDQLRVMKMRDVRHQLQRFLVHPLHGAGHARQAAAGFGADVVQAHVAVDLVAQPVGDDQVHLVPGGGQRGALLHEDADVVARVGAAEMGDFHWRFPSGSASKSR